MGVFDTMSEVKYERLYVLEKYDACAEEIEDLLLKIRCGCDVSNLILESRIDACAVNFESHVLALMLEGNADVAKSMNVLETSVKEEWLESSLVRFYYKIKALSSCAQSIPFSLYLNSLYNSLWWFWAKGTFHDEDKDVLFEMLEDCFQRVSVCCNMQVKHTSHESRGEIVLAWLYGVVENITYFEITQCLQIVDICVLCIHLFLHFKWASSEIYRSIILILKDSWPLVKTKFAQSLSGNNISTSNARIIKLFKFGFLKVNETTEYNVPKVSEYLRVMGCLLLFELGYLQDSADFHTRFLSDNCNNFLCLYSQAYVCLQLRAMNMTQLHIRKLSSIHMSQSAAMRYHLLKGQHACLSGLAINAHLEFRKILPSKQFVNVGLIHILNNLRTSVHSYYDEMAKHGLDVVIDKLIRVLHCFQTFITNTSYKENNIYSAENKLFGILDKGTSYKTEDVFCAIAKDILWIELHRLSSNARFKATDIAAKCYMNVLCSYYKKDSSLQIMSIHSEIVHEAVVALILCEKLDEAKVVCQILLQKCSVLKEGFQENSVPTEDVFLMENGVAAFMLMAYINIYQRKHDDAHNFLTRIKKTLLNVYFSVIKPDTELNLSLVDAVIAKVYVVKALLYMKAEFKLDALHCCQKALVHNTDEDTVEDCMNIARKIGAEISVPSPRKRLPKRRLSITLKYLLTADLSL